MSKRIIAGLLLAASLSPAFALPRAFDALPSSDQKVHRSALVLCVLACLALGARGRRPRPAMAMLQHPYTLRYSAQYDDQPERRGRPGE